MRFFQSEQIVKSDFFLGRKRERKNRNFCRCGLQPVRQF